MSGVSGRGHGVRLTVPVVQCGRRRNERERKKAKCSKKRQKSDQNCHSNAGLEVKSLAQQASEEFTRGLLIQVSRSSISKLKLILISRILFLAHT